MSHFTTGLFLIENAFSVEEQLDLAEKALRVYPKSTSSIPNQTNLDQFYGHVDVTSLFNTIFNLNSTSGKSEQGEEPPMKKQKITHDYNIAHIDNIYNGKSPLVGENSLENQPTQSTTITQHYTKEFLHQLRWITLGYHYNWTKRIYQKEHQSPFPSDLFSLNQQIATWAGTHIIPEAAIINYYHLGKLKQF